MTTLPTPYYDDGNGIVIYHSDCREILPLIETKSIDLVLTDPPYGTTMIAWDQSLEWSAVWPLLNAAAKDSAVKVVFSVQPFTTDLIQGNRDSYRYELIWSKTMGTGFLDANRRPLRAHENLIVFCDRFGESTFNPQKTPCAPRKEHSSPIGQSVDHYNLKTARWQNTEYRKDRFPTDVLAFSNGHGGKSDHPTAKPLGLMKWLVSSYSNPNDLILDPFMGSGTTLRAAKDLGRRAIGIELEETYCRAAVSRLSQSVMQFDEPATRATLCTEVA